MICQKCSSEIAEEAVFCPECGAIINTEAKSAGFDQLKDLDSQVVALLSEANLLRIRKKWRQAQDKCIAVLRKYPNSPLAHFLMGHIYEDQRKLEDAIDMYKAALELDPKNRKLQIKVAQVTNALKVLREKEKAKVPLKLYIRWRTVALATFVTALFLLVGLAIIIKITWENPLPDFLRPGPPPPAKSPLKFAKEPAFAKMRSPAILPYFNFIQLEEKLLGLLKPLGTKNLQIDPENLSCFVTFEISQGQEVDKEAERAKIMQDSLKILEVVTQASPQISKFVLRAESPFLGSSGNSQLDVAFIGQISRDNFFKFKTSERDSVSDFLRLFDRIWWHPQLR